MDDSLGKKIKHLRKTLDLTQNDLSCEILSRSILSKIETDKVTPSIYQLNYLATKLNVTTDILLNETLDDIINRNEYITSTHIHKLFCEKLYLDIISTYETKKSDFFKKEVNLFYLGISYYNMHFYKEAIIFLKKYINYVNKLDYYDSNKNINYFIKSINTLASIYFDNNQLTHSIKYIQMGKNFLENNNLLTSDEYLKIIANLLLLNNMTFNYNASISICTDFLPYYKEHINMKYLALIHIYLAIAYQNTNEYEKAKTSIETALFFYKYLDDQYEFNNTYLLYITNFMYCLDFENALNLLKDYNLKYSNSSYDDISNDALLTEAYIYFNTCNYTKANIPLSKLNITKLDKESRNNYNFLKGHIAFINNDYKKSIYYLTRCEKYFLKKHYFYDLSLVYYDLYKISNNNGYIDKLASIYSRQDSTKNILCKKIELLHNK